MNDFESRLKDLLNESVDERVGPRRPAPPFGRPRVVHGRDHRPRPPWLLPLLAAACVAAVVGGIVGTTRLVSDGTHLPATRPPSPTVTTTPPPTSTPSTTSAPSTPRTSASASTSQPPSSPTAPPPHAVRLGSATISLPANWVARNYQQYLTRGSVPIEAQAWCLTPASRPVSTAQDACPLLFGTIDPNGNSVNANIEGGYESNPEYCRPVVSRPGMTGYHQQSEDRTFGGRAADWRRWELDCQSGNSYDIEQYVVPTVPGYILFSETADATVHAAMTEIAGNSELPPQTLPVRLYDVGYLRSIHRTSGGVQITVDRIAYQDGKVIDNNPQTYSYLVPTAVFDGSRLPLKVGALVYLSSNGRQVNQIYPY